MTAVILLLVVAVTASAGQAGGPSLDGEWRIYLDAGYYSNILYLKIPGSTINPSRLTVSGSRWVLSRGERNGPRKELAVRVAWSAGFGTVRMTDKDGKNIHSGRFERVDDKLHLYLVPGERPPNSVIKKPKVKGAQYVALEFIGKPFTSTLERCLASRSKKVGFATPRATFDTFILSLEQGDLALFRSCFIRPPDPPRDQKFMEKAKKHLIRSCFIRSKQKKQYMYFWYLVGHPNDASKASEDKGRMQRVDDKWLIHKL